MIYIRQDALLEKKHGLEMGRETYSKSKYFCGRSLVGKGKEQSVDMLLLYMVYKVPGEYHSTETGRQYLYVLVRYPYQAVGG